MATARPKIFDDVIAQFMIITEFRRVRNDVSYLEEENNDVSSVRGHQIINSLLIKRYSEQAFFGLVAPHLLTPRILIKSYDNET